MVMAFLVDMALDYVSEKAVQMSAEATLHYLLKVKDRNELKHQLQKEMNLSIKEIPLDDVTLDMITSEEKKGKEFRKGIINSVLIRDENKEKDWFVTVPPIPKGKLDKVKKDVDSIVKNMQEALWPNALFRKIVGDDAFQNMLLAELNELKEEMVRLRQDFEELKTTVSDLSDRVDSISIKVTVVPTPVAPTNAFIGREGELKALDYAMSKGGLIFVSGFGGIGKTELCRKFSSIYSVKTGCKVVWTTYKGTIKETIATNVRLSDESSEGMDIDVRFLKRKDLISNEGNILLIIDNYEWGPDISDIKDIGCNVILTTREMAIPADYHVVKVDQMNPDESFNLLCTMASEDNSIWIRNNEQELRKKLQDVGYHTLTVSLMGGLIAENLPDCDETVDEVFNFKECEVYSRDRGYDSVMGHIETLFNLSSMDGSLVDVLKMASIMPVSGMEYTLFLECSGADRKNVKKLIRLGWLKKSESLGISIISVHPIVSEFIITGEHRPFLSQEGPCRIFVYNTMIHIKSINETCIAINLVPYVDFIKKINDLLVLKMKEEPDLAFIENALTIISDSYILMGMYSDLLGVEFKKI